METEHENRDETEHSGAWKSGVRKRGLLQSDVITNLPSKQGFLFTTNKTQLRRILGSTKVE